MGGAPSPSGGEALVTGASGFVGGAVVRRLRAEGRTVRALVRSDDAARAARAAGARPVSGDVLDPTSLLEAMRGCGVVFHAAGVNAMCAPDPEAMLRTNVEGTANVVRAAAAAGVRRVVHTSSASTIGEPAGTVGREDTPHRGRYLSAYERSKHRAELRALELGRALGLDVVCVNPASVQGPGRTGGTARLLLEAVRGRLPFVVDARFTVVDVEDCALGHLLAADRGRPGERYLLAGATLTVREALELFERVAGSRPRVRFVPPRAALIAAGAVEAAARAVGRPPPVCREMVRTLLHGHAYDGGRAARELGLTYTPIEETLRRTLAWYVEQGMLPAPVGDGGARATQATGGGEPGPAPGRER
ncbi:MAG TPA: NAD-dependent epimerase/dehydratase family protein [Actinomycetota bacterium]|nr:NAD-dependent epimerase/dehydratase family protein [Actinomycetota bacterium]